MLTPNSATLVLPWGQQGTMPTIRLDDGRVLQRPHPEWDLNQLRWRWLLDSLEGGEAYRTASYGIDLQGMPIRNLIRHKREYPAPFDATYAPETGRPEGSDQYAQAGDDDYEMRRARTPVPTMFPEAIHAHLDAIFEQEIRREGPAELETWWEDVDGRGTNADDWWADTLAPLLLALANLDVIVEPPPAPDGADILTKRDQIDAGLDKVQASYILPENVVWWSLDRIGEYREVLIREVREDQSIVWRYWTADAWQTFDAMGKPMGPPEMHRLGFVPIVRLFDRRRPRSKHVGMPRYEAIAEIQREIYNRQSELIISDSTQAFPLLQGPDDYVQPDGTIAVGPNWLLPMKGNESGSGGKSYQGFSYIDPPKGAAESIRLNCYDLRDAADRLARLTKPAGVQGTSAGTVGQSGVAKSIDETDGNRLLGKIARTLAVADRRVSMLALRVLRAWKPPSPAEVRVAYPSRFSLVDANGLADFLGKLQLTANTAGALPRTEGTTLKAMVREGLKGLPDDEYEAMDAEIDALVAMGPQGQPADPPPEKKPATPASQQDDTEDYNETT